MEAAEILTTALAGVTLDPGILPGRYRRRASPERERTPRISGTSGTFVR
jgi:hypothetical protein